MKDIKSFDFFKINFYCWFSSTKIALKKPDAHVCTISSKMAITPHSRRFCDDSFLRYLDLCNASPAYYKLKTLTLYYSPWINQKLQEIDFVKAAIFWVKKNLLSLMQTYGNVKKIVPRDKMDTIDVIVMTFALKRAIQFRTITGLLILSILFVQKSFIVDDLKVIVAPNWLQKYVIAE